MSAAVRAGVTSVADATEHAQSTAATVTSRRDRPDLPATQRKRHRASGGSGSAERQTYFSRTDWSLFLDPGVSLAEGDRQRKDLRRLALREWSITEADAGAEVTIYQEVTAGSSLTTAPGMNPDDVARLFSVNRTLVSSKQLRLPTRGMVGNGLRVVMGAIAAFEGNLTVTTRGRHMRLAVDRETGLTDVTENMKSHSRTALPCSSACQETASNTDHWRPKRLGSPSSAEPTRCQPRHTGMRRVT